MKYWLSLAKSKLMYELYPGRLRQMRRFYSQFVGDHGLCFDIGAHIGNRTRVLAKLGCDVITVEPHPFLANYLRRKFDSSPSVRVVEAAVGDVAGAATLHASPAHLTVSSIKRDWVESLLAVRPHRIQFEEEHVVQVLTLDQLIEAYGMPKYIKIDVEGLDTAVLSGLSQAVDVISFEHLPHLFERTAEALSILDSLAHYRHNFFTRESHRFCLDEPVGDAELLKAVRRTVDRRTACDIFSFRVENQPGEGTESSLHRIVP